MTSTGAGGPLVKDIAAYERMQEELERDYAGKWVVFHNGRLARTFDEFEESAEWALDEYGEKHFLNQEGWPGGVAAAHSRATVRRS